MTLYVAFFTFRPGAGLAEGLQAFERRKTFQHPPRANLIGEFWVSAPPDKPQAVVIWEAEDEAAGDYYEAYWGDLFEVTICQATRPVMELPNDLSQLQRLAEQAQRGTAEN